MNKKFLHYEYSRHYSRHSLSFEKISFACIWKRIYVHESCPGAKKAVYSVKNSLGKTGCIFAKFKKA